MNLLRVVSLVAPWAALVHAGTATVTVNGTSNLWLAGMPHGTACCSGDSAPGQSPVLVPLMLIPGTTLTFAATGATKHGPAQPLVGPDGRPGVFATKLNDGIQGMSYLRAQLSSLIGVFLSDDQPDLSAEPATLDFSDPGAMNFLTLAPALKQTFFIGDGLAGGGETQEFIIPAGATRLYLGTFDGYEWNNNGGELSVTVRGSMVPEPGSLGLLAAGLGAAFALRRGR